MANYVRIIVIDKHMFPLPPFYYFEIAALVAAFFVLTQNASRPLKWFRYFLLLIILVELFARYKRKILHEPNVWIYNLSIPLEYLFYAFIFYHSVKDMKIRKIGFFFLICYPLFVCINLLFIQGMSVFNSHSMLIGSLSMMVLSGLMLYDLFIRENQVNIVLEPLFWIASGVLLFNAGEFGYYLFSNYLINDGIDKAATFFSQLNSKLIFVLYSCIVIGFVCHRITEKYKKG